MDEFFVIEQLEKRVREKIEQTRRVQKSLTSSSTAGRGLEYACYNARIQAFEEMLVMLSEMTKEVAEYGP